MAEHEVIKEQMHTECISDCDTVCSFLKLTDEMVKTILELDEELIRWRQALIKYLPSEWADGLQQDIFNNTSRDFEGDLHTIYMSDWPVAVRIHNRWLPESTGCTGLQGAPMRPALHICNY